MTETIETTELNNNRPAPAPRVVVVGSGMAGTMTAVELASRGVPVALYSSCEPVRSQSNMAEGGMNAVLPSDAAKGDDPSLHAADTLRSGRNLASPSAVQGLCESAADIAQWLIDHGTSFSRDDDKQLRRRSFGGHSHPRALHVDTMAGSRIMKTLDQQVSYWVKAGLIQPRYHCSLVRLCFADIAGEQDARDPRDARGPRCGRRVIGACFMENAGGSAFTNISGGASSGASGGMSSVSGDASDRKPFFVPADAIILATGGMNSLFPASTGSALNSCMTAAMALGAGIELANLEFVQYHPTTFPRMSSVFLISEAARGEGGRLFAEVPVSDEFPEGRDYFMEREYPMGNLEPRDVVSRAMARQMRQGRKVFLDLTQIGPDGHDHLKTTIEDCLTYSSIDVRKQPIPVSPGVHFFMGGIKVNGRHETSVAGLYAAGECAAQYHGANRLGGNSILGALHGGRVAAGSVAEFLAETPASPEFEAAATLATGSDFNQVLAASNLVKETLGEALGVLRSAETLEQAKATLVSYLAGMKSDSSSVSSSGSSSGSGSGSSSGSVCNDLYSQLAAEIVTLGLATVECALARKESRGAHARDDFPDEDPTFQKTTVASLCDGALQVSFEEVEA